MNVIASLTGKRTCSAAALLAGTIAATFFSMSSGSLAQNARGSATGPTTAPGYDHPGQYLHLQDVKPAEEEIGEGSAEQSSPTAAVGFVSTYTLIPKRT
jgi:hypothetical protein